MPGDHKDLSEGVIDRLRNMKLRRLSLFLAFWMLIVQIACFHLKVHEAMVFHHYYRLSNHLSYHDEHSFSSYISKRDIYHPERMLFDIYDMADVSGQCDRSENEILDELDNNRIRSNLSIIQRDLPDLGVRYNVIEYDHHLTHTKRLVIAIRGTKNVKNLQSDLDSSLDWDQKLGINVHRGFKHVYTSILKDLMDRNNPVHQRLWQEKIRQSLSSSSSAKDNIPITQIFETIPISIHLTGHSLGGAVACLLGEALTKLYNIKVASIVGFGVPKFTNKHGSMKLSSLPLTLVEHVLDPIVHLTPLNIPFLSSGDYHGLNPHNLVLLEPIKENVMSVKKAMVRTLSQSSSESPKPLEMSSKRSMNHKAYIGRDARDKIKHSKNPDGMKFKWHFMKSYQQALQTLIEVEKRLYSKSATRMIAEY